MKKILNWLKGLFIKWYKEEILTLEQVTKAIESCDTNLSGKISVKEIVDCLKQKIKEVK